MTANLGSLKDTVIQGPLLSQLRVGDAVRLAGVNRHLRTNIGLGLEAIGTKMTLLCTDRTKLLRADLEKVDRVYAEVVSLDTTNPLEQKALEWVALDPSLRSAKLVETLASLRTGLHDALASFILENFPSEANSQELVDRITSTLLVKPGKGVRFHVTKEIKERLEAKIQLLERVEPFYRKHLTNSESEILLNVAKLARIFPNLIVRELEDIDRVDSLMLGLQGLIQKLYSAVNESQVFPLALALQKPGVFSRVDDLFKCKIEMILDQANADFAVREFRLDFLGRFTCLTKLQINGSILDALPPSVLRLPIKELDIQDCQFKALPPIPMTVETIQFKGNPIQMDSELNHNLHSRIMVGIIKQYQFVTNVLCDDSKHRFARHMFSKTLQNGKLTKTNNDVDTSYEILGTPVFVVTNQVIYPYQAACGEIQEIDADAEDL